MQFDFGQNWAEFSANALDEQRVTEARSAFAKLLDPIDGVANKSFIDIGFGQGLALLTAASMGAQVFGIDISPKCAEVLNRNRVFFKEIDGLAIPFAIGSILDDEIVAKACASSPEGNGYDIVHSWGVLHHTGDMRRAISNASGLVKPHGHLVLALYNRHWSSSLWRLIKFAYCKSPHLAQRGLVWILFPVIYVAKWMVTGSDPLQQTRGMNFYYDVVDWVGGYPYEFASQDELISMVESRGFKCIKSWPSRVPTGCNEFVFQRSQ